MPQYADAAAYLPIVSLRQQAGQGVRPPAPLPTRGNALTGSHGGRGRARLTGLGVSVPQRGRCAAAWDLVGHCLSRLAPPLPLPAVRLLPSIRIGRSGCAAREWAQPPVILLVFRRTSMVCCCRAGAAFLYWSGARQLHRSHDPSSAGRTAGSCRRAPRLREHPSSAMLS